MSVSQGSSECFKLDNSKNKTIQSLGQTNRIFFNLYNLNLNQYKIYQGRKGGNLH